MAVARWKVLGMSSAVKEVTRLLGSAEWFALMLEYGMAYFLPV